MAWTAATNQTLVQAARDALITAEKQVQLYMLVNNPGALASANAACTAAAAAITALQA